MIVFGPTTVVVVLSFVGIFTNALVVVDSWRKVETRTVLHLVSWSVFGLLAGTEILRLVDPIYIKVAAAVLVIIFAMAL